ncbi:lanthionine synthetase C family protein [Bacillus amyloliquefaciens]|uniref:lanthionine synthetase C family protein n=1 Tax=Bacillus amyloliquefaciens TaxID=1390 RepID=UPI0022AF0CAE|nr:lanthionine synthetase C family protein [Bacillus amyloliquefaciens]MCZ4247968.1 lanthionine synthetase C family protein [Bacillus amyloliquefaciens]
MDRSTVSGIEIETVKKIARQMSNFDKVLEIVNQKDNFHSIGGVPLIPWKSTALSHGIPGICILYGELNAHFPAEGWDELGHQYLSMLVDEIKEKGLQTPSMFSGAAGIGLAAVCLSQDFAYYNGFIARINEYLAEVVPLLLNEYKQRQLYMTDYDVIEGVSGIASYLLLFQEDKRMKDLLIQILKYLVRLTEDINVKGEKVPGWHIPSLHQFTDIEKKSYPYGNFNIGLAHGIPGPICILSSALMEGIKVNGQEHAVEKMVEFLLEFSQNDKDRLYWKGIISFEEYQYGLQPNTVNFSRDAWCYGRPGVCLALVKAGKALRNNQYINLGVQNLKYTISDIQGIFSPTICHGFSGIAQILLGVNQLTGQEHFKDELEKIKRKIVSFYDKNYIFGFHNYESLEGNKVVPLQYVGLLDGVVGVGLGILNMELGSKTEWTKALLI